MSVRFLSVLVISALVHALLLVVVAAPQPRATPERPLILTLSVGKFSVESVPTAAAAAQVETLPPPELLAPRTGGMPTAAMPEQLLVSPREIPAMPKVPLRRTAAAKLPARPAVDPHRQPEQIPPPQPMPETTLHAPAITFRNDSSSAKPSSSAPQTPSTPRTQGVKSPARLIGSPRPVYPRTAQLRGWQGEVMIWLDVSAEGKVLEARVHKSSGYAVLDAAALRFAESLELVPARQGGRAIASQELLPVRFRLTNSP